jgi:thymidylate synthase
VPVLIEADTIGEGWVKLVRTIMDENVEVLDERRSLTKELRNTITHIRHPVTTDYFSQITQGKISVPDDQYWTGEKLETYTKQFLSPENPGFVYTYGNRLRDYFWIDQIQYAIDRLKNCEQSRRATTTTWDPQWDNWNDEVPCMILVDFKIRGNQLNITGVWRSHDIYGAWLPNAVGLTRLGEYVAKKVGVKMGSITIQSISAHIYENNFEEAGKI